MCKWCHTPTQGQCKLFWCCSCQAHTCTLQYLLSNSHLSRSTIWLCQLFTGMWPKGKDSFEFLGTQVTPCPTHKFGCRKNHHSKTVIGTYKQDSESTSLLQELYQGNALSSLLWILGSPSRVHYTTLEGAEVLLIVNKTQGCFLPETPRSNFQDFNKNHHSDQRLRKPTYCEGQAGGWSSQCNTLPCELEGSQFHEYIFVASQCCW
jgi:hypothetical protein